MGKEFLIYPEEELLAEDFLARVLRVEAGPGQHVAGYRFVDTAWCGLFTPYIRWIHRLLGIQTAFESTSDLGSLTDLTKRPFT